MMHLLNNLITYHTLEQHTKFRHIEDSDGDLSKNAFTWISHKYTPFLKDAKKRRWVYAIKFKKIKYAKKFKNMINELKNKHYQQKDIYEDYYGNKNIRVIPLKTLLHIISNKNKYTVDKKNKKSAK